MSEESRMKKTIIRIAVCVVVFLASALIIGSIMNQGHNNMTMEMAPATLPMITMESGGVACNELHGNTVEMDVAYQKDCITLLGEGRQANFTADISLCGNGVNAERRERNGFGGDCIQSYAEILKAVVRTLRREVNAVNGFYGYCTAAADGAAVSRENNR